MAEFKNIGRHVYRRLTDEEARREFGSSFVFVGQAKPANEARELLKEAEAALGELSEMRKATLTTEAKKSNRSPK
jgi:hypothetical protein